MATVTFKCSTLMKRFHTISNKKNYGKDNCSYLNNISKLGDSMNQFPLSTFHHKIKRSKLYFPAKDSSHGDSSIEFHEKYPDSVKHCSKNEDDTKTNRFKFNTNELSISSIYEEEKKAKLSNNIIRKQPNKNPIIKSEFKSFKKYTYKALNQPEEITHNLNILGDISDSDDNSNTNQKDKKEIKEQQIITEQVRPKQIEDEFDLVCNVMDDEYENTNEEDIGNKISQYQTIGIPNSQFNKGSINYKNLLTNYYNDDIDSVSGEKIGEMEKTLVEIEMYRKSIEESKELIQKLRNQLESQATVNQINQSSLPYPGKLPDEDYLLCELMELKHRYNTKTEKFKTIVQKLKCAITQSTTSTSPSNLHV